MTTLETIIQNTLPTTIVKGNDFLKAIYGKRHVAISYDKSKDLFNVHAFTLKGINLIKESKINGLFISDLEKTIKELR